jgi:hypothetical protein
MMRPAGTASGLLLILALAVAARDASSQVAARDTTGCADLERMMSLARPSWTPRELPAPFGDRLSLTASEVPPFPREDPLLMNPRNWPRTMDVEGVACSLSIEVWYGDYGRPVPSLDDVPPGTALELSYRHPVASRTPGDRGFAWAGPSYWWGCDGALYERAWRGVDGGAVYVDQYYPSGQRFTATRPAPGRILWIWPTRGSLDEIFAPNGAHGQARRDHSLQRSALRGARAAPGRRLGDGALTRPKR